METTAVGISPPSHNHQHHLTLSPHSTTQQQQQLQQLHEETDVGNEILTLQENTILLHALISLRKQG